MTPSKPHRAALRRSRTGRGRPSAAFLRSAGKAAPAFSPTQVAGMELWLKTDSLAQADGAPVVSWIDASGKGRNASAPNSSRSPILKVHALNGQSIVRFDGIDDVLHTPAFPLAAPLTYFLVVRLQSVSNNGYLCDGGSSNSMAGHQYPSGGDFGLYAASNAGPMVTIGVAKAVILCVLFEPNSRQLRLNNQVALSLPVGCGDVGGLTLGSYYGADAYFSAIDVAEVLIYSTALDQSDETSVREYLNQRYALY